ncbi:MAG: polyphenol oxidase family protein, partial [Acidobacteriota bacterium]|nr:polyphenol oxidase family protein [Acidobacteriota bacterium]
GVLAVLTADCGAVALGSPEGVHGAVHVGWRGLAAGVVEAAVEAMGALGAGEVVAGAGPCIGPCCYEFSAEDLEALAGRYGPGVRATTTWGAVSLDLPAAVRAALAGAGAALAYDDMRCTACGADAYSHRRRRDEARQALLVWPVP